MSAIIFLLKNPLNIAIAKLGIGDEIILKILHI